MSVGDLKLAPDDVIERMRERAKDVVAKVDAEPGWRACVATTGKPLGDGMTELALSIVPVSHWGILRTSRTFGPFAGSSFGALFGGGAESPVPMSDDGLVLDAAGFWGLASPAETDEDVAAKFKAEVADMNVRFGKSPAKGKAA